jgi:hypothetical protein
MASGENKEAIRGPSFVHALIRIASAHDKPALACFALVVCAALQGCVSVEERQVSDGVFEIATPANRFVNSEDRARVILGLRARELCPQGFSRFSESRILDAKSLETMIWRIACNSR